MDLSVSGDKDSPSLRLKPVAGSGTVAQEFFPWQLAASLIAFIVTH